MRDSVHVPNEPGPSPPGSREPAIHGRETPDEARAAREAVGFQAVLDVDFRRTSHEGRSCVPAPEAMARPVRPRS